MPQPPDIQSIFDHTPDTLRTWCTARGLPAFTADQILDWVYKKHIVTPEHMTNLSAAARRLLDRGLLDRGLLDRGLLDRGLLTREMIFTRGDIRAHQTATDGTEKLLIAWNPRSNAPDSSNGSLPVLNQGQDSGNGALPIMNQGVDSGVPESECVMIPTAKRRTACISSQVGCPVGCTFCASGIGGLETNLTAGAIVEQVHHLHRIPAVDRITNIVFMGMGEPLANYRAVTDAVRTLNAPWAYNIGARRITISTVGLPQAIRRLITFEIPITLALSLHAPNDELRRRLIPWAQYTSIDDLLDACDGYFQSTGREITFEYLLLGGVNDQLEHARELIEIARRIRANVNLIRYNEVAGLPYERPTDDTVRAFHSELRRRNINVHIRASRGRDIAAACGQLRHEKKITPALTADTEKSR